MYLQTSSTTDILKYLSLARMLAFWKQTFWKSYWIRIFVDFVVVLIYELIKCSSSAISNDILYWNDQWPRITNPWNCIIKNLIYKNRFQRSLYCMFTSQNYMHINYLWFKNVIDEFMNFMIFRLGLQIESLWWMDWRQNQADRDH